MWVSQCGYNWCHDASFKADRPLGASGNIIMIIRSPARITINGKVHYTKGNCVVIIMVTSLGAFDMFGYAFSSFRTERKYKDLYEYTVAKQKKHAGKGKTYTAYIIVGVIFLVVSYIITGYTTAL